MIPESTHGVNRHTLACHRCGAIDQPLVGPGSGPNHARARCRHCGAHLGWLSASSPAERQARREQAREAALAQRPPSGRQLDLLSALGYAGSAIGTMLSASITISGILQRGQEGRV